MNDSACLKLPLALLLLAFFGSASADTVRLKLGADRPMVLDAYLTLSGSDIIQGSDTHYFEAAEAIAFEADYGAGAIDFTVESIDTPDYLHDYIDTPAGQYSAGFFYMRLTETTTDPGNETSWLLDAGQNPTPGVLNDYYVYLRNLSTGDSYGVSEINGAYFTEVTTVPVPAALLLFGSALAGLGCLRRKRTA